MSQAHRLRANFFKINGNPVPGAVMRVTPCDEVGRPMSFASPVAMIAAATLTTLADNKGVAEMSLAPTPEGAFYLVAATDPETGQALLQPEAIIHMPAVDSILSELIIDGRTEQ